MITPQSNLSEHNLALLKKNHPDAWQKILRCSLPAGKEAAPANNTGTEAESYLEKIPESSTGVVILLGIGSGNIPLEIIKKRQKISKLLLYDLNPAEFRQNLSFRDFSPLLEDQRVVINIAPFPALEETLNQAAVAIQLEDTHFLKLLPSFAAEPGYHALSDSLYPILNRYNVGGATAMQTGRTFLKNRLQNLEVIQHHRLLDELQDKFTQVPAILVGGGPSLNKNIRQLKEIGTNALIIAVDSTLPALTANGIRPHFISTLDPDEVIYEKMADCAPSAHDVSLLCMLQTATTIPKTFPAKQVFWGLGDSITEQWLAPILGAKVCTDEALTVANLSLAAAITMGANPIIFVGQDLAYTNFETHAAHTVLDNKDFLDSLKNGKDDLVWVKGINGGQVPTDRGFFSAKNHFESLISKNSGNTYINATEGGAHLEGTTALPLADTIEKYCATQLEIPQRLETIFRNTSPPQIKNFAAEGKNVLRQAKELHKIAVNSKKINQTALKQIRNHRKNKKNCFCFQDLPAAVKNSLVEIDKLNLRIEKPKHIWKLLQDITLPGLKESERLRAEMLPLQGKPQSYLQWLTLHLKRFTVIDDSRLNALDFLLDILGNLLKRLKQEEDILNQIKRHGETQELLGALATLYIDAESFALAKPLVEKLLEHAPESPLANFYNGCVLTAQRDHAAAKKFFQAALSRSTDIAKNIDTFLFSQGARFLDYSKIYRDTDRNTSLNLLLKGLFFHPEHEDIRQEIRNYAAADLEKIKKALQDNQFQAVSRLAGIWHTKLEENEILKIILPPEDRAECYYAQGCILSAANEFTPAAQALEKALAIAPDNAEYNIAMVSVKFAYGDFANGIIFLQNATNIDKSYAGYWEQLGDSLLAAEQHADAIMAYEQYCFALPPHPDILKKIGECYLALGKNEAALEAFNQAKSMLDGKDSPAHQ